MKTIKFTDREQTIMQRALSIYISEICSGLRKTADYRKTKEQNLKEAEELLEKVQ